MKHRHISTLNGTGYIGVLTVSHRPDIWLVGYFNKMLNFLPVSSLLKGDLDRRHQACLEIVNPSCNKQLLLANQLRDDR